MRWVSHRGISVSLLSFDPVGRLVGSYFATNATIDGIKTLTTALIEAGLF